ncbi:hypothetical protein PtrSN002B_012222, partial [Pyrenophora tritici-repentis]
MEKKADECTIEDIDVDESFDGNGLRTTADPTDKNHSPDAETSDARTSGDSHTDI